MTLEGINIDDDLADKMEKRGLGRPRAFNSPEELLERCIDYFKWVDDNPIEEQKIFHSNGETTKDTVSKQKPYTVRGMCLYIGISRDTWYSYAKKGSFSDICAYIEDHIYNQKLEGASAGIFNHAIIARHLGLADKVEETKRVTLIDLSSGELNENEPD